MPIVTAEERIGGLLAEKYRLDRVLGKGGFGTVYAGVHEWTNRPIAAKVLDHELLSNQEFVARFLQEARSAAKLDHPNVVDVLDMGKDADGTVYLVLELLTGEDLAHILRRKKSLPLSEALTYLLPIMDALAAAHERGIIHRDLKPANIFVSVDALGRTVPKLLDFGIAKDKGDDSLRTKTGQVWGTPHYMSPEQAMGNPAGSAADVWSMGVVLFQCLAGKLPFANGTAAEIMTRILTTRAKSIGEAVPELAPELVRVIDRALEPELPERYRDMGAFLSALLRAAGPLGLIPTSASELRERRERDRRPTLNTEFDDPTDADRDVESMPTSGVRRAVEAPGTVVEIPLPEASEELTAATRPARPVTPTPILERAEPEPIASTVALPPTPPAIVAPPPARSPLSFWIPVLALAVVVLAAAITGGAIAIVLGSSDEPEMRAVPIPRTREPAVIAAPIREPVVAPVPEPVPTEVAAPEPVPSPEPAAVEPVEVRPAHARERRPRPQAPAPQPLAMPGAQPSVRMGSNNAPIIRER